MPVKQRQRNIDIAPNWTAGLSNWQWLIAEIEARRARAIKPDPRTDKVLAKVMRQ
jgi:hypothetical protein